MITRERLRAFTQTAAFLGMVAKEGARIATLLRAEGVVDVATPIEAMSATAKSMLANVVSGMSDKARTTVQGILDSLLAGAKP